MATSFNKREIYKCEVQPLVKEIEAICTTQQIPFFFTAAVYNNEKETEYKSCAKSAMPMDVSLTNDLIVNHLKVSAGFECILPETMPDIEL